MFRETVGREGDEGVDKATATRMRARFHENRNRGMEIEQAASSGPINECGFRGGSGSGTEINYSCRPPPSITLSFFLSLFGLIQSVLINQP